MLDPGGLAILIGIGVFFALGGVCFVIALAMARADTVRLNRMTGPRIDKRMAARIEARQKEFAEAYDRAVREKAQAYLDRSAPASTPPAPTAPTPDGDAA